MPVDLSSGVCTIFEGHYHFGVAALINSLHQHGFRGRVWLATRGARPPWTGQMQQLDADRYMVGDLELQFLPLEVRSTMSAEKPLLMKRILTEVAPQIGKLAYFDADIVAEANWTFFERWMSHGVALCEDNCLGNMSEDHLLRHEWRQFSREQLGITLDKTRSRYFNGGFVGLDRRQIDFLDTWIHATNRLPEVRNSASSLKYGDRCHPFNSMEQDTLNLATMVSTEPLATLGQEGMGFTPGMNVMWHAVDNPKPWQRHYVSHLLRTGIRIAPSQRKYWEYANGLLRPWTNSQLAWRRLDLLGATALSRFYHSA